MFYITFYSRILFNDFFSVTDNSSGDATVLDELFVGPHKRGGFGKRIDVAFVGTNIEDAPNVAAVIGLK